MLLERLFILILALAATGLIALAWRLLVQSRFARLSSADLPLELAQFANAGQPAVLYFTTENCAQCRFQQSPILGQLVAQTGVAVHAVDAVEQEGLARFFGIMTVPSTVLLDGELRPSSINHGLAPLPRLQEQLALARPIKNI